MHQAKLLENIHTGIESLHNTINQSIEVKIPDEIDVNINTCTATVPVSGTLAVTNDGLTDLAAAITNSKMDVNLKSSDLVSLPVSGTVAVTNDGLTDLAAAVNNSKIDVNLKSNEVASFPVTGTVAITNSTLDTIDNQINSSGLVITGAVTATQSGTYNVNVTQVQANPITLNTGIKAAGTIRMCIADDDTNLKKLSDCVSGTNLNIGTHAVTVSSGSINATCSGSVSITGTPAVTVSSGSINATCSGTVAVTSSDVSSINSRQSRQSGGSLESLSVAEYKLIYKSQYPDSSSAFINYYESFNTNCQFQDADGGINIFPIAAPTMWMYGTRFNLINGNNTWLIVYPGLVGNSSSADPNLEVGIQYYDTNGYIVIANDYAPGAVPLLKYSLNDIDQSAGVAMSSWNVDVFNGSGASGLTIDDTTKKYALSWFIMLGSPTNYAYIGLIDQGKLWVGHQFSIRKNAAVTSNTAKSNQQGFRPYYKNSATTASKSVFCGGFEIYSKLGNYMNLQRQPYNFYNSYTLNSSTTVYPFAIFARGANLTNSYINLRKVYAKTTGSLDTGDFRVEIWHTVDVQYTITGGTQVDNITSTYFHGMTSITGGTKIHTILPNADNCINEDISWIDHKHFGFQIQSLGGYTSIIYFLIVNMSASVNKTAYFSVSWSE